MNTYWHQPSLSRERRQKLNGHRSFVIWLTGLSGSGKSTLAHALDQELHESGIRSYVLDGDNIRHGLSADLGFSASARKENIRRVAEVSKLMVDAGVVVIAALISPFHEDRELAKRLVGPDPFIEIFMDCPLEECERRDPKGLYRKARAGQIMNFTGISSPYEKPEKPDLTIQTDVMPVNLSVKVVVNFLRQHDYLPAHTMNMKETVL